MRKTLPLVLTTLALAAQAATAQSGRRVAPPPAPQAPTTVAPEPEATATTRPRPPVSAAAPLRALPESVMSREFQSLEKGSFRLSDFGGKVVVLNLWASWCGPCRSEIPEYERVRKEYEGRGIEFVGLTTENPKADGERVRRFVREYNFGFRLGWADRETAVALMNGRNVIPQTIIVAPGGRVVRHIRGFSAGRSGDILRDAIERALADAGEEEQASR